MRKFNHAEAFALMWYACPCGHRERIWNSRDGVTPFGAQCPSCGSDGLRHVEWARDVCCPDYEPVPGQRVWVDLTRERAEESIRTRAAVRGVKLTDEHLRGLVEAAFVHGTPPDLRVQGYDYAP